MERHRTRRYPAHPFPPARRPPTQGIRGPAGRPERGEAPTTDTRAHREKKEVPGGTRARPTCQWQATMGPLGACSQAHEEPSTLIKHEQLGSPGHSWIQAHAAPPGALSSQYAPRGHSPSPHEKHVPSSQFGPRSTAGDSSAADTSLGSPCSCTAGSLPSEGSAGGGDEQASTEHATSAIARARVKNLQDRDPRTR
jgi:hypothetical protein